MDDTLTIEKLMEAQALIEALSPKKAPEDLWMLTGTSGLRIFKGAALPPDSIMVSTDIFDKLFSTSEKDND